MRSHPGSGEHQEDICESLRIALGDGPRGFSFEASLITLLSLNSLCVSSIGFPGT